MSEYQYLTRSLAGRLNFHYPWNILRTKKNNFCHLGPVFSNCGSSLAPECKNFKFPHRLCYSPIANYNPQFQGWLLIFFHAISSSEWNRSRCYMGRSSWEPRCSWVCFYVSFARLFTVSIKLRVVDRSYVLILGWIFSCSNLSTCISLGQRGQGNH